MRFKTNLRLKLFAGVLIVMSTNDLRAQSNTQITVSGIRSAKGQVVVSVFKDEKSFDEEIPFKKIPFDKKGLVNGTMVVNVKLDPGTYGLVLVDDENKNGKLEKNFVGVPKEGFGFSNFFMEKLKKPSFHEFKMNIKGDANKAGIRVKYM